MESIGYLTYLNVVFMFWDFKYQKIHDENIFEL